jgi:hypothetical protein
MKKFTIFLLVSAAFSTPTLAAPISYTINFTTTNIGTPAPTSGSFTYDSVAPLFSGFTVVWEGFAFDLTSSANSPGTGNLGCNSEGSTPQFGAVIMFQTATGCSPPQYIWVADDDNNDLQFNFLAINSVGPGRDVIRTDLFVTSPDQDNPFTNGNEDPEGTWSVTQNSVPEPSTFGLLLLALATAGISRQVSLHVRAKSHR